MNKLELAQRQIDGQNSMISYHRANIGFACGLGAALMAFIVVAL